MTKIFVGYEYLIGKYRTMVGFVNISLFNSNPKDYD